MGVLKDAKVVLAVTYLICDDLVRHRNDGKDKPWRLPKNPSQAQVIRHLISTTEGRKKLAVAMLQPTGENP